MVQDNSGMAKHSTLSIPLDKVEANSFNECQIVQYLLSGE